MKSLLHSSLLLFFLSSILPSCKKRQEIENRKDLRHYYFENNVDGFFVVYDATENKYTYYNQELYRKSFLPASTFKICNSLIALETGVIPDENFVLKWDGIKRENPSWNVDQDLKTAFKNSTVWYYQEIARRVGGKQMKYWLDNTRYGNADTSGGIDQFWLTGGLRISPEGQIDFLKKLHDNKLPFKQRTMDVLKKIMMTKESPGYFVRAKTGWGIVDGNNIGWYVGYVEKKDRVYYFVNLVQSKDPDNKDFASSRIDIAYKIMNELKITSE